MKYTYTVKKGESPADVAQKFTGDRQAYRDLLVHNPQLPQKLGRDGATVFSRDSWRDGLIVRIPRDWAAKGPIRIIRKDSVTGLGGTESDASLGLGYPNRGSLGDIVDDLTGKSEAVANEAIAAAESLLGVEPVKEGTAAKDACGAAILDKVTSVKPYYYRAKKHESMSGIASKFGMTSNWKELRNANLDWVGGLTTVNNACVLNLQQPGFLRVPGNWPEPSDASVKATQADANASCGEGMIYVGGRCYEAGSSEAKDAIDTPGGGGGGGYDVVGQKDDKGSSLWLWVLLGVAGAAGAYLLLRKRQSTQVNVQQLPYQAKQPAQLTQGQAAAIPAEAYAYDEARS